MRLSNCGAREDSWTSLRLHKIKLVNPKRNQPWTLIGRTDAEVGTLATWWEEMTHDAEKDWRQKRKRAAENKLVILILILIIITDSIDMNLSKLWKIVEDKRAWCAAVCWVIKSQTWLSDKTTTTTLSASDFNCLTLLCENNQCCLNFLFC